MGPARPFLYSPFRFVTPHISFSVWWWPRGPLPDGPRLGLCMRLLLSIWFCKRLFCYDCIYKKSGLLFLRFYNKSWYCVEYMVYDVPSSPGCPYIYEMEFWVENPFPWDPIDSWPLVMLWIPDYSLLMDIVLWAMVLALPFPICLLLMKSSKSPRASSFSTKYSRTFLFSCPLRSSLLTTIYFLPAEAMFMFLSCCFSFLTLSAHLLKVSTSFWESWLCLNFS